MPVVIVINSIDVTWELLDQVDDINSQEETSKSDFTEEQIAFTTKTICSDIYAQFSLGTDVMRWDGRHDTHCRRWALVDHELIKWEV